MISFSPLEMSQGIPKGTEVVQTDNIGYRLTLQLFFERSFIMLLISTKGWITVGVAVLILIVVIANKVKDKYY